MEGEERNSRSKLLKENGNTQSESKCVPIEITLVLRPQLVIVETKESEMDYYTCQNYQVNLSFIDHFHFSGKYCKPVNFIYGCNNYDELSSRKGSWQFSHKRSNFLSWRQIFPQVYQKLSEALCLRKVLLHLPKLESNQHVLQKTWKLITPLQKIIMMQ